MSPLAVIPHIPDRIDITSCSKRNRDDHIARYTFACKYAKGKHVLDIACGTGYGTDMLRKSGAAVLGVDISQDTIKKAKQKYGDYFATGDIRTFQSKQKFDMIVCFETIEHISEYHEVIQNLYSLLKKNGRLLISSPNKRITKPLIGKPMVSFHAQEFTPKELTFLLNEKFTVQGYFAQRQQPRIPCKIARSIYGKICRPQHRASPVVTKVHPWNEGRYFIVLATAK
ncbi:class I SAM-dependent methyltransferase [Candidatus Peribacteria bacterium]|nr:class I SAM-dependent methyltransferase [Candidatus Peribacteria bacterium]